MREDREERREGKEEGRVKRMEEEGGKEGRSRRSGEMLGVSDKIQKHGIHSLLAVSIN